MAKSTVKRGRPAIFVGVLKSNIVRLVKTHGLMRAQRILASEGVQAKAGQKKSPVKISLPTLSKFANEAGLVLKRGRPVTKAA